MLFDKIIEKDPAAEVAERVQVHGDGSGAFGSIAPRYLRRHRLAVRYDTVDYPPRHMLLNCAHMIRQPVTGGLSRLCHQVRNVDPRSFGARNRRSNLWDQEIWQHASVQRPRAHQNQVGLVDRSDSGGKRTHTARWEGETFDTWPAAAYSVFS